MPMSDYQPDQPVWVYRAGAWRPGRIVELSHAAALVRYRPTGQRGSGVDTILPGDLAPRDDVDPFLDPPEPAPPPPPDPDRVP